MTRTANPNTYLDRFQSKLADGADRYRRLEVSLEHSGETDEIRKGIAEDSAFRLGVLWETFQGDWFLAAVSREPKAFVGVMQGKLNTALHDKWARDTVELINPGALTVPRRPTLRQIERMIDPQGHNITFADSKIWKKSAERHLMGDHLKAIRKIADNPEAESLVHLVKKMRNHLAHSSSVSKNEFNKATKARAPRGRIGLAGPKNNDLKRDDRGISDLGKYLRARPRPAGSPRIEIIHERLSDVSELLRV